MRHKNEETWRRILRDNEAAMNKAFDEKKRNMARMSSKDANVPPDVKAMRREIGRLRKDVHVLTKNQNAYAVSLVALGLWFVFISVGIIVGWW